MKKYTVGPSHVQLTGGAPAEPGAIVEHDFSVDGPDGEHGPGREAALIAAGALTLVVDQPSPRRRLDGDSAKE